MRVERDWRRVTRANRCRVCGKPDYCAYSGDMCHCMRVESRWPSKCRLGGWIHVIGDSKPVLLEAAKMIRVAPEAIDWDEISYEMFWDRKARIMRRSEAARLGVSEFMLVALGVGYGQSESGEYSTWPERKPDGHVSGIAVRYTDGRKMMIKGSRHGLYYDNLQFAPDKYGPIFIPEGGTDVAAIMGLGLNTVGRPSNTGCISELASFLKPLKHHKNLIVLGERDRRKVDDHNPNCEGCVTCWPGLAGAQMTARRLSAELGREVCWAMPDAKDVREWINLNRPTACEFLNAAFKWSQK